MTDLANRTVLITGASAGIGEATAVAFARCGARLVLVARRRDRLDALSTKLQREFGVETLVQPLDLRRHLEAGVALAALPDSWGAVDILVNNAGLVRGLDKLHEGEPTEWDEVMEVNVRGLLAVSRALIPGMVARGRGHIVNIGSIAGHEVYPNGAIYCATKHAVRALSKGMLLDLLGTPVRVTSIDPGLVETEFSIVRFRGDREQARVPYLNMTPLTPEDVAEAVIWSATRPPHVNVATVVLLPTDQASSTHVHRRS